MVNSFIELKDLSKYYSSKDVVALGLRKVSLKFERGEFVAVCGESGSGKSTLMNVISGMDTYEEGEMFFNGEETSCFNAKEWDEYRRQNVSFVFQDYNLIDSYTVLQNVELALLDNFPNKSDRRNRALDLIDKVGLASHKKHRCTKLSGGQKQRVAIARALAKDAPILIADEPTGNLDSETSLGIIKLLTDLSKDKLLLVVTHNFDDVKDYATRKIRLFDGSVAEDKVVKPKNIINDNTEEFSATRVKSKGDFAKDIKDKLMVAFNNVIATPKKSLFAFTTFLVASLLVLTFILSVANIIMRSPDSNLFGERKDTAVVFYSNRSALEEEDRQALNSIDGVKDTMLLFNAYEYALQPRVEYVERTSNYWYINNLRILNVANYTNAKVEHGSLPKNDNEILLSFNPSQAPKLELIGQTIQFIYGYRYIYGYDNETYNNELFYNDLVFEYKVVGFTSGHSSCYLTTNSIEEISRQAVINDYTYSQFHITHDQAGFASSFYMDDIIASSDLAHNQIYLIMDKNDKYFDYLLNLIPENGVDVEIYRYSRTSSFYETVNLKVANQEVNSDIFVEHFQGERKLLLPTSLTGNLSGEEFISQAAKVIIDVGKNTDLTLQRITNAGYKVIYPYNANQGAEYKILVLVNVVTSSLMGLFFGGLAVVLLSSILYRVLQTKKKDYNILRILGMSQRNIRTISYFEFILINVFAFLFLTFVIVILYTIGLISSGYKLMGFMNTIFPYGLYHSSSLMIFLSTFALLMILTTKISNRFNRKLFNLSIKKSSVEM